MEQIQQCWNKLQQNYENLKIRMIEYYQIPEKKNNISNKQILTIMEEYELKDAIYNKQIFNIKMLNMKNSNINDDTVGLLWTISQPLQIISINLSQNFSFITDLAIENICQSSNLKELKYLNLADNSITNEGLRKLSKSKTMMKLQQLILYGNSDINSQGLVYLAQSDYIKKLKYLDLHDTSVCDKGLNHFLRSQNSAYLQTLDISMNSKNVSDHTLKAIAYSKYSVSLKQLKAEDCNLTDEGVGYLCESQNCSKLQVLNLNNSMNKKNNLISDKAMQQLAFSKYIKKLRILELRNTDISSKGINLISVSLNSQNLQILRLSHCVGVKDNSEKYLESIINYRNLQKLYVNSTMISKETGEQISKKYPNLSVIF